MNGECCISRIFNATEVALWLIKAGAGLESLSHRRYETPLFTAVNSGSLETLIILLQAAANPNAPQLYYEKCEVPVEKAIEKFLEETPRWILLPGNVHNKEAIAIKEAAKAKNARALLTYNTSTLKNYALIWKRKKKLLYSRLEEFADQAR